MLRNILAPLLCLVTPLSAIPVFIGTNTGGRSASKGIYQATFDPVAGRLSEPELAAEYRNPGFLALHPDKPLLYAVGQPRQETADKTDAVAAFRIEPEGGLKFLGEATAGGRGACHLAVDGSGRTVAVANYGDGRISTVRLTEDGVPAGAVSVISNSGSGPNKQRQDGPHAHGVYFSADNSHLFVPDLGLDRVLVYPFDAATSELGAPLAPLESAAGAGPRHMAVSPDGRHAYVIDELANTITTARLAGQAFEKLGTVGTLPEGFEGWNSTAEVEVHPNGKFVYGSNRGHNSIAIFRRDAETGTLEPAGHADCGGKIPRHFKIAPGGKWLLCAHQESNTISVLPLDPATGKLGVPVQTVAAPSPICVLFGR